MRKTATAARKSLILLALGVAASAAAVAGPSQTPTPTAPTASAFSVPVSSTPTPPSLRVLDIKAPDIHQVMSDEQIAAAMPNPEDTEVLEPETIAVHGESRAPYVPGGFAALYWAANHPFDAWRILTPVQ